MAYEVWRGPSALDGVTDIVLLLTGASQNSKTGGQLQTWIMRSDMPPNEALKAGLDGAICGDCTHRSGSCYVLTAQGPRSAWESWHRDPKPVPENYTAFANVRLGAYGEIPAIPFEVVEEFMEPVSNFTGFTHAWRYCDQRYRQYLMASVESIDEAQIAHAMGWRTYRTMLKGELRIAGESLCPGSEEAGKKLTCSQCGFCNGNATNLRGNVAINVHGAAWKVERFSKQPQRQVATMVNTNEATITCL